MTGAKRNHRTLPIFLGMAIGLLIGTVSPPSGAPLEPVGLLFIRLIACVIAPLMFSTMAARGEERSARERSGD